MACGVTDVILKGPPERSMAALTVEHFGFQPTVCMMWAGSRLAKSICQSANSVWNTTVTVRPSLEPFTEAMSRYPATLATEFGSRQSQFFAVATRK